MATPPKPWRAEYEESARSCLERLSNLLNSMASCKSPNPSYFQSMSLSRACCIHTPMFISCLVNYLCNFPLNLTCQNINYEIFIVGSLSILSFFRLYTLHFQFCSSLGSEQAMQSSSLYFLFSDAIFCGFCSLLFTEQVMQSSSLYFLFSGAISVGFLRYCLGNKPCDFLVGFVSFLSLSSFSDKR